MITLQRKKARNGLLAVVFGLCCFQASPALAADRLDNDVAGLGDLPHKALALERGKRVDGNPTEAVRLYCKAAKAGDADSLYRLGWMYTFGKGVARDDAAAAYFFGKAAELGHPQSANMLRLVGAKAAEVSPCVQAELAADVAEAGLSEEQRRLVELIRRLAPQYGVAPGLAVAMARTESDLNPRAVSEKHAQGLMQLIPETAERFSVRKPFDPEQNVRGGLAYVRWLLAYFRGDVRLVAAAYNAGEGAVNKFLGVPPYRETRKYVANILAAFRQTTHPFDASVTEPSPEWARIVRRQAKLGV